MKIAHLTSYSCFWTVVLEKTLESSLDCKEIQPIHPKGNQSWIFIGRNDAEAEAPILWPPDVKSQLIRKGPDARKDWRQAEKGSSSWGCEELDTTEQLHFYFSLSCIGEGNGNPLQCSCLENPRDRSLVGCHLWGRTELDVTDVT